MRMPTWILLILIPKITLRQIQQQQSQIAHLYDLISFLDTQILPNNYQLARTIILESENYYNCDEGIVFYLAYSNSRSVKEKNPRLVVPQNLKHEVLVHCHDIPLAGHRHLGLRIYRKRTIRLNSDILEIICFGIVKLGFAHVHIVLWKRTCEPRPTLLFYKSL